MANKYWETETPKVVEGEKSVVKVYAENGKVQVFPKVTNSKYGIGKGATIDLETMDKDSLIELHGLLTAAINKQLAEVTK